MALHQGVELEGGVTQGHGPVAFMNSWDAQPLLDLFVPARSQGEEAVETAADSHGVGHQRAIEQGNGAVSYYPDLPISFNTLLEMAPGRGYWVRMEEAGILIYP